MPYDSLSGVRKDVLINGVHIIVGFPLWRGTLARILKLHTPPPLATIGTEERGLGRGALPHFSLGPRRVRDDFLRRVD